jgi:hypothetical protein
LLVRCSQGSSFFGTGLFAGSLIFLFG